MSVVSSTAVLITWGTLFSRKLVGIPSRRLSHFYAISKNLGRVLAAQDLINGSHQLLNLGGQQRQDAGGYEQSKSYAAVKFDPMKQFLPELPIFVLNLLAR